MQSLDLIDEISTHINSITDAVNEQDYEKASKLATDLEPKIKQLCQLYQSVSDEEQKAKIYNFMSELVPHLKESMGFLGDLRSDLREELIKVSKGSKGLKEYRTVRRNR